MIAFASTKTGGRNVWIKQAGTGEAIQVTKDEFSNEQPIWSPGGEELAFFSTRGNQTGVWRIPILGGSPKFVATVEDGGSLLRFWSKNGLIYYESFGGNAPDVGFFLGGTVQNLRSVGRNIRS